MDWVLDRANVQSHCEATLGNIKVTDITFCLWLGVVWTKTKTMIQDFGDILGEPVRSVCASSEDTEGDTLAV